MKRVLILLSLVVLPAQGLPAAPLADGEKDALVELEKANPSLLQEKGGEPIDLHIPCGTGSCAGSYARPAGLAVGGAGIGALIGGVSAGATGAIAGGFVGAGLFLAVYYATRP